MESLKGFFVKKANPAQIVADLQVQEAAMERQIAGLQYDRKRSQRLTDEIVKRGVDGAANGNTMVMKAAALELKAAHMEMSQLNKEIGEAIKSRCVVRIFRGKLKRCAHQDVKAAYDTIADLLGNERLRGMLASAEISESEFSDKLNRELDRSFGYLQRNDDFVDEGDTSVFINIYEASQKGDERRVAELMREATGESALKTESFERV